MNEHEAEIRARELAAQGAQDVDRGLPWAMPKPGSYPCVNCGGDTTMPGICGECADEDARRRNEREVRKARESVPDTFRWARPSHAEWVERVTEACRRELRGLPPELPRTLMLLGPAGAGKTSAACALLHRIHDRAARPKATADEVQRGRRAYFVSVPELIAAHRDYRGEVDPAPLRLARGAGSVLVLDDLRPGKVGDIVDELTFRRFNRGLTTIFTTWMSKVECQRHYGEGMARRAYERVIEC